MGSRKPRQPTLRDVAQAAGVSIWTASNTFSHPTRVAAATRQRVLAAADALDYAGPNPGARALALGRTRMVALATEGDAERLLTDPAAALVAQGLLTACDRAGLSLVLTGRPDEHLVDGRVLYRVSPPETRGPAVVVGDGAYPELPSVVVDVRPGVAALIDHLTELGHRWIAVLGAPGNEDRLTAVVDAWPGEGPLTVFGAHFGNRWPTRADGEAAARAAVQQTPRPTALIALTDTLALGAMEALHRTGLRVPDDVSVTGIDDAGGADAAGLTTVVVPHRPCGELAGDLLVRQLDREPVTSPPPLPTALTLRRSTGPPPTRTRRESA